MSAGRHLIEINFDVRRCAPNARVLPKSDETLIAASSPARASSKRPSSI